MMKVISTLIEQCDDEIQDAESYVDNAMARYDHDKELADIFHNLAAAEVEHFEKLHAQTKKEMQTFKERSAMDAVMEQSYHAAEIIWNYEEERMMKALTAVKVKISMY